MSKQKINEYRAWHKSLKKMCAFCYVNWDTEEAGLCIDGGYSVTPLDTVELMKNTHKQNILKRMYMKAIT